MRSLKNNINMRVNPIKNL